MNELLAHLAIGMLGLLAARLEPRMKWLDAICAVFGAANLGFAAAQAIALVMAR